MSETLAAALADRYRIERELGQGGMATVHLGHDLRHDRDFAIKVLQLYYGALQYQANIRIMRRAPPRAASR